MSPKTPTGNHGNNLCAFALGRELIDHDRMTLGELAMLQTSRF